MTRTEVGCLSIIACSIFAGWFVYLREPGYIRITRNLVSEMKGKVDVDEVNVWMVANGYTAKSGKKEEISPFLDLKTLPQCIQNLHPVNVFVDQNQWMVPYWGGGFGHWGIRIGPKGAVPIQSNREYDLRVEDGVYAWGEIQR